MYEQWRPYWRNKLFRNKLALGLLTLVLLVAFLPYYFAFIEARKGIQLNDIVLNHIDSANVSVPTFIIIWSLCLWYLYKSANDPALILLILWGLNVLFITRIISIYLVPLDPPTNLVELIDPITNRFYGAKFITKDLFFSGHTATLVCLSLCLRKRRDQIIVLSGAIIVGILVLVQHVHYTIDVIAAFVFPYFIIKIARRIIAPFN